MDSPKPYKIDVAQSRINSLNEKLSLTRFPDELGDSDWDYGTPLHEVRRLSEAWKSWDWKQAEKKLNEVPQFQTGIGVDGYGKLEVHFIHQTSDIDTAIPLLFVHGWPGSFIEVLKILPHLVHPEGNAPAFHVIAPSLPNFGFSQSVSKRGFALAQYAETCHKLMLQLGYRQYITQAGDWGFWITRAIGKLYPDSCRASHINMVYAKRPAFTKNPLVALQHSIYPYSEDDKQSLVRKSWFQRESRGYNILQSTKPQTLAYALNDSPIGLISWIYEKLHDWSDAYSWTDDEILTWISIYQFSRAGPGAAGRIYYEVQHTAQDGLCTYDNLQEYTAGVKLGLTYNPKDLENAPTSWGRTLGPVVYEAANERGGHFYAHECPQLLVEDVRTMFGKGGGAYGVVMGHNGYD